MADIFISYAREDIDRVRPIVKLIEDNRWSVFWDQTIPPGMTWRGHIGKALDEAKCIIVVWSRYSIKSEWVTEEADEGRSNGILIPIRIDDVRPPLGFRNIQHGDFSNWKGESDNRNVKRLIKAIEIITGKPAIPPEKPIPESPSTGHKPTPSTLKQKFSLFFRYRRMCLSITVTAMILMIVALTGIWTYNQISAIKPQQNIDVKPPPNIEKTGGPHSEQKKETSKPKSKTGGQLFIAATPDNAQIYIDKINQPFKQGMVLPPNTYHVKLSKKGYKAQDRWVDIGPGEEKQINIQLEEIPPKFARLYIETVPEETRIRILNIKPKFYQGIELKPGNYKVEISAENFETEQHEIVLKAGHKETFRFELAEIKTTGPVKQDSKESSTIIKRLQPDQEQIELLKESE